MTPRTRASRMMSGRLRKSRVCLVTSSPMRLSPMLMVLAFATGACSSTTAPSQLADVSGSWTRSDCGQLAQLTMPKRPEAAMASARDTLQPLYDLVRKQSA